MTVCNGAPRVGGPKAQLLLLRASVHPVTKLQLPQATWLDGSAIEGAGTYSRRQSGEQRGDDEDFVRYVPEVLPVAVPRNGASAAVKRDRLLLKIRAREVRRCKLLRREAVEAEAREVYADFIGSEGTSDPASCSPCGPVEVETDESSFWESIVPKLAESRFGHVCETPQGHSRGCKPSRMQRLLRD